MFGILAGMALFSASIRGHLQIELERAEEAKLERTRQETQALARAVESAIMTETSSTYSTDVTLDRIMPFADGTTGRTAGGSAAQINTFQTGPMGRVMVGLTDDGYVRNELATAVGDLTQSQLGGRSDVALVDIAALRTRQMEMSLKNLDQEAGLLYYFWNRQNRFPTDQAEYKAQVNAVSGLRDFWGRDFTYTALDANNGGLAFTTPWGEARSISVTMTVTTSTSTPLPADVDPFTFTNVPIQIWLGASTQSNAVTVTGFSGTRSVSVAGEGSPQIQIAGGAWLSSGTISPGQSLRVRLNASSSYNSLHTATVTVGTYSTNWSVRTRLAPTTCPSGNVLLTAQNGTHGQCQYFGQVSTSSYAQTTSGHNPMKAIPCPGSPHHVGDYHYAAGGVTNCYCSIFYICTANGAESLGMTW
jgi:hypothetical protein